MDEIFQFPQGGEQNPESRELSSSSIVSQDLPEEWGGRPKGSSRRAIRMQVEYDKRREDMIQERSVLQAMDIQRKQFEINMRDQQMQEDNFYYDRGIKEAEQKLRAQQMTEAKEFTSAANSLDPRSPNYRDQLIELRKRYPIGSLDPTISSIIGEYDKVHSVYMEADKENRREQKQEQDWRVQQEAMATELGISVDEFKDPETGEVNRVGLMQRVGEERRAQKEKDEEKSQKLKLDTEQRSAVTSLNREIRDIDDELDSATAIAKSAKGSVKNEAMQTVDILNKRRNRRKEELQLIYGDSEETGPEVSEEDVSAARKAIQENPDSPQAKRARQIIEAYEASRQPTSEEGGGETISDTETVAPQQPTPAPQAATQPSFLTQEEFEVIPETRRDFATGEMAETMDTLDGLRTELDRLYKAGYKFSVSKKQQNQYRALQKQISEKRKEETKLRAARQKEIREEMNKLGSYSSGENRKKYITLQQELRLISGV